MTLRQIDHVRLALLNLGWATPWTFQKHIAQKYATLYSDSAITARIRELHAQGLPVRKRKVHGSRSYEYAVEMTPTVEGCRRLWAVEPIQVDAALREHAARPPADDQMTLPGLDVPRVQDDDTTGRYPSGKRRPRR